jgi:hypothetical protein
MFLTRLKAWFCINIRQEEKYMREVTKDNTVVLELESLVAELHNMMNCQKITDDERIDLRNKIVALFANG